MNSLIEICKKATNINNENSGKKSMITELALIFQSDVLGNIKKIE